MTSPATLVQRTCHPLPHVALRPVWRKYRFRQPVNWQAEANVERFGGARLKGFHPVVPDNGYINFLAAVNKRCNYYDAGTASRRTIKCSINLINRIAPEPLPEFQWSEDLYSRWLARFGHEKQQRMVKAMSDWAYATPGQYSDKEVFVKVEALLVAHKPNWAPRVINKGSDIYNAIAGPMFWELMHRLDAAAEHDDGPHQVRFAYGRTPEQYVPFLDGTDGDFVESDFSANDKKQCQDVLRLEAMLMRRLGCPEWFVRLHLRTHASYKVKNYKHGFQATIDNQLATGVADTTFRNCFWNWCILSTFLHVEKSPRSRCLILGDDMLARIKGLKRNAAKRYTKVALDARMDAKVSRHGKLVDCSFLSKSFVPLEVGHCTVVPLLGKALGRFNTRANNNGSVSDNVYFGAKALSYAYEFRFVPQLRDVFLDRWLHHLPLIMEEKNKARFLGEAWEWNARQAGLSITNFKDKLLVDSEWMTTDADLTEYCWYRYGLSRTEIVEVFEDVVLDVSLSEYDSPLVQVLARDFV